MTSTQRKGLQSLEAKINAWLKDTPADKRPEMSTRRRVRSVAYSSAGYFEATDSDGHTEMVSVDLANAWMAS